MDPPDPQPGVGILHRKKRHWSLPLCILSIAVVEFVFYTTVVALFTMTLTWPYFNALARSDENDNTVEILRVGVISFAGVYILLAFLLMFGTLKKHRHVLLAWMVLVVVFMTLEWICVVTSVAIFLNGTLFFISGSYGPVRLYFVCLIGLYVQRLKFAKQHGELPIVVQRSSAADGYSVVHNAIFTQSIGDDASEAEDEEPMKVTFEIKGTPSDQSLV